MNRSEKFKSKVYHSSTLIVSISVLVIMCTATPVASRAQSEDSIDFQFGRYVIPTLLGTWAGGAVGAIGGAVLVLDGSEASIDEVLLVGAATWSLSIVGGITGAMIVGHDKWRIATYGALGHIGLVGALTLITMSFDSDATRITAFAYVLTYPFVTMAIASRVDRSYSKRAVSIAVTPLNTGGQLKPGLSLRINL